MKSLARRAIINVTPPIITALIRKLIYRRKDSSAPLTSREFRDSDSKVLSDEYIQWLCYILGGWLTPGSGNLRAFDHAIRQMPIGGAIVEVGSFLGLSTNIIAYLTVKYRRDNPFFACDPWLFEGVDKPIGGYFAASSEAYRQYTKEVYKMNVNLFSGGRRPHTIESTSAQFFKLWSLGATTGDVFGGSVTLGGSISFAYVDGAHAYDAAKQDFVGVNKYLLPGGFILFDDSADGSVFGVTRVVAEVEKDPSYELVFKTPNYFFRKRE